MDATKRKFNKYINKSCLFSYYNFIIVVAALLLGFLVTKFAENEKMALSPGDPSSYSRPEIASVTGINLNLSVDFTKKIFTGYVELSVKKLQENANEIILDVLKLQISKIIDIKTGNELKYTIGEAKAEFGSKLTLQLPKNEQETVLKIIYETSPEAAGLQWLEPQQTSGKKQPFVFSQFQAINARSFVPCQDTPSVKTTYTATITAPKDLTVLMSAIPAGKTGDSSTASYKFEQKIPIPSYLLAVAIGDLDSRKIGPRSHVWAEPAFIDASAFEFADTETQLETAESICGPYVWGIYDLLVLPPSFAFGGMENPCLTFVTPTLLAGDRSLANVVAHEIAHSWTGNLVTNRNFEQFWLNEGFTVFIERKIKGRLTSAPYQDFDAIKGLQELQETVKQIGEKSPLTHLVVDLKGVHPDDAFSTVPYEKGHTFLRYLEALVGGPRVFEPFLRLYFAEFMYKSIETADFQRFFSKHFEEKVEIGQIDWAAWLHSPGMPPVVPNYDRSIAAGIDRFVAYLNEWKNGEALPTDLEEIKKLPSDDLIYFLQKLVEIPSIEVGKLVELEKVLGLNGVKNAEIKFRWLRIGLKAKWEAAVQPTLDWLNLVGRMKYVRPLYRDLYAWSEVRQLAIANFNENKKRMMHVVAYTVSKDLHLK